MQTVIKEKLKGLADDKYRLFVSGLLPNTINILGVRLPLIRNLAREIAQGDWRGYLAAVKSAADRDAGSGGKNILESVADCSEENVAGSGAKSVYLEEIMLQGMVLGFAKCDIEEILRYVAEFVPKIDNWSVCDSFCAGLKFTKHHKERVWDFLQPYFASKGEF